MEKINISYICVLLLLLTSAIFVDGKTKAEMTVDTINYVSNTYDSVNDRALTPERIWIEEKQSSDSLKPYYRSLSRSGRLYRGYLSRQYAQTTWYIYAGWLYRDDLPLVSPFKENLADSTNINTFATKNVVQKLSSSSLYQSIYYDDGSYRGSIPLVSYEEVWHQATGKTPYPTYNMTFRGNVTSYSGGSKPIQTRGVI